MGKGCVCRNLVQGAKVNRDLGEYDIPYCVPFLLLYPSYPVEDSGDSFRVSPRLPSFLPNVVLHLSPFSQVAGIKGIFLANKKVDDQVKTYITYNKGRDWRLLQAPDVDLRGSPVHCLLVSYDVPCEVPRAGCFPGDTDSRCPSSIIS